MCIYICICIIQCLSVVKTNRFCNVFVQYISSTINRTIAENYVNISNEKLFFRFYEVIKYGPAYKLL